MSILFQIFFGLIYILSNGIKPLDANKINVVFDEGVSGIIDLSDFIQKGIFQQLKDPTTFRNVYTDGTSMAWSNQLEIDVDAICALFKNVTPSQLFHIPSFHTAD